MPLRPSAQIHEINSGIYAFDLAPLFDALRGIASQNAQGEYYLTDLVAIYRRRKLLVKTFSLTIHKKSAASTAERSWRR